MQISGAINILGPSLPEAPIGDVGCTMTTTTTIIFSITVMEYGKSVANRSLENGIFLGLLSDCSVLLCGSVAMSSITLGHRLSYRAENLNIASLLGYLGRFLSVFRNFAFFGL